jgi:hypothetical protein
MIKSRGSKNDLLSFLLLFFLFWGCNVNLSNLPIEDYSGPDITIDAFATENIDKSYWQYKPHVTAFFYVECTIVDPDGIDDIIEVKMDGPYDDVWTLKDNGAGINMFDDNGQMWHRFYTGVLNRIPIGEYVIMAKDTSGNEVSTAFTFGEPGSTTGTGFVYSDEYDESKVDGKKMIERVVINNVIKAEDTITVEFTIDDERVFNGRICFYDAGKNEMTRSGYIKNIVNDGNGIYTDGSLNILVLQRENLDMTADEWKNAAKLHFVVTDGEQFLPEENIYHHRSISALYIFEY